MLSERISSLSSLSEPLIIIKKKARKKESLNPKKKKV